MILLENFRSQYGLYIGILLLRCSTIVCFWPVGYSVHLKQKETYNLFPETLITDNTDDDEMLKMQDIEALGLDIDSRKLDHLHSQFKESNNMLLEDSTTNIVYYDNIYDNYDANTQLREDMMPVSHNDKQPEDILNRNIVKRHVNQNMTNEVQEYEYNYENLKDEYYSEMKKKKISNSSYTYAEKGKPEETIKESVEKIVVFKKPKNCSKEESINFGVEAIGCLWMDYKKSTTTEDKIRLAKIFVKIFVFWLLIYAVIALPCWCQRGWCCCCCCCITFCQPTTTARKAKEYFVTNPPGLLVVNEDTLYYKPTIYEIEAYKELETYFRKI